MENYTFEDIVHQSELMDHTVAIARKYAKVSSNILIAEYSPLLMALICDSLKKSGYSNITECQFGIIIRNSADVCIGAGYSEKYVLPKHKIFKVRIKYPYHQLSRGTYSLNFALSKYDFKAAIYDYDWIRQVI